MIEFDSCQFGKLDAHLVGEVLTFEGLVVEGAEGELADAIAVLRTACAC